MHSDNIRYMPRLDHLRFLAAAIVFIFHWYHQFFGHWQSSPAINGTALIVEGYTGVSLFFVLSGYLFMTIALGSGGVINYGMFLRNRALRIFPLFIFIFAISLSLTRDKFQPEHLLYFFATNLGLSAPTSNHFITGAAWTISVEFTFYLVFPFLARFAIHEGVRYLPRLMLLLLVFKLAGYLITERSNLMFYSTLLGRFDQFLVGMLAAQIFSERLKERRFPVALPLVALLLVLVLLEIQGHWASFLTPQPKNPAWIFWPTIEAAAWAFVIVAYLGARGSLPIKLNTLLEKGGEITFSIYLWHAVVIFIVEHYFKIPGLSGIRIIDSALALILCIVLTGWISRISYSTIEQPFLDLRKKYTANA